MALQKLTCACKRIDYKITAIDTVQLVELQPGWSPAQFWNAGPIVYSNSWMSSSLSNVSHTTLFISTSYLKVLVSLSIFVKIISITSCCHDVTFITS